MKRLIYLSFMLLMGSAAFYGCESPEKVEPAGDKVPDRTLARLVDLGFNVTDQAPMKFQDGYLVEGDIYLTDKDLAQMEPGRDVAVAEQYSTDNLVTGTPRNISVYLGSNFSSTYSDAVDEAIDRYNAEGLSLTFSRASSSSGASIAISRLPFWYEWFGVLGSAGFPTAGGDPYSSIQMSGILESSYGLSMEGIATIIAHEMGHCIGFRHTDYFDRSISCGGSADDEGDGGVGANHIPGTPTGAALSAQSWMLSCTDGSDRPFNGDDQTALDHLY